MSRDALVLCLFWRQILPAIKNHQSGLGANAVETFTLARSLKHNANKFFIVWIVLDFPMAWFLQFFSFNFFFLLILDQSCFSPVTGAFPHPQKPAVLPNTFKWVFQLNIKWIIKRKWKKCIYFLVSSIFCFWLASHLNTTFFVLCTFLRYITSIGPVILESATPNHLISTRLPGGTDSNDFNVTIRVDIYGKDGASNKDEFIVKVFWLMLPI